VGVSAVDNGFFHSAFRQDGVKPLFLPYRVQHAETIDHGSRTHGDLSQITF
jgi:hypothetical protein